MLMLHTGLRVSEVSNILIGDISISARREEIIVRGGKGEKLRTLPLNSNVRNALKPYLSVRPSVDHDYLFIGQKGKRLRPPGIYYLVKKYGYEARIEDISPHTLRHTFGKHLVDAGVPLDRVATLPTSDWLLFNPSPSSWFSSARLRFCKKKRAFSGPT